LKNYFFLRMLRWRCAFLLAYSMKKINLTLWATAFMLVACSASAHMGLSNLNTPISAGGQKTFAIANTSNELVFNVPHGCVGAESVPAFTGNNLDTVKIEITVPAAIVTATTAASLRPVLSGAFDAVTASAPDGNGNVKLTWVKKTPTTMAPDNQVYKVALRLKVPAVSAASDFSIKKYQFLAVQTCKDASEKEVVMDWGVLNSPTLLVFPDKRKGFNQFTLGASVLGDFADAATLAPALKSYFGDAAIVWVKKAGYSPNPLTAGQINELILKDGAYTDLGAQPGKALTTNDILWVKY
jgi:hypothetical protein